MDNRPEIEIGGYRLGAAHPTVFWPDIDVYFRRNETKARQLIDAVVEAGCIFLKGAVLHRADLALEGHQVSYFNHITGTEESSDYRAIMNEVVTPLPQLSRVLSHGRDVGLKLVLSVYDLEGVHFAVSEKACALKVPSSNITHKRLIEAVAQSGLPMVMDTGRSCWSEIDRAVSWAKECGASERLLLQHSPPGPPAPSQLFHMRMLNELEREFAVPVGLSDHHRGLDLFPVAVALGACIVEKGLVNDANEKGIDQAHALPVAVLGEALDNLAEAWQALGLDRRPNDEVPANPPDRMGCVSARALRAGRTIAPNDIDFAFPAIGISAWDVDRLVGARLITDMRAGTPFSPAMLAPS